MLKNSVSEIESRLDEFYIGNVTSNADKKKTIRPCKEGESPMIGKCVYDKVCLESDLKNDVHRKKLDIICKIFKMLEIHKVQKIQEKSKNMGLKWVPWTQNCRTWAWACYAGVVYKALLNSNPFVFFGPQVSLSCNKPLVVVFPRKEELSLVRELLAEAENMVSSLGIIHYPLDIGFIPSGGGVLVPSLQLCLPRKLIICGAKFDSTLDGTTLVDVIENSPRLSDTERPLASVSETSQRGRLDSKKLKAVSRVSEAGLSGSLPPHIIYLLELGLDLEQIKVMSYKCPSLLNDTLEGNIRPLIEFLLDLGVSKSELPRLLIRFPGLCGMSLSEDLIPRMAFFETLGVDKTKWVKLLPRFPKMLTHSQTKIEATVEFLYEVGLSRQSMGKILTRWPKILSCSIDNKLRPLAEYFQSLGVDIAVVLRRCPSIVGFSIEDNLKPVTEFFLEKGFSIEEIGDMISRFGGLYASSLKGNLVAKWELFLTMDYPREDLVMFPQYFSYSLENRIKPRYNLMKESGVDFSLTLLLNSTDDNFELLLKKKIKKLQLKERC